MTGLIRKWWRQPDHFYWLATYLTGNGALPAVRAVMIFSVLGLGAIPVAMIWSPAGPTSDAERAIAILLAATCVVMATLWMGPRWPSKMKSIVFVFTSTTSIAVACLIISAPIPALMACVAFAPIGGYIAFFHTARFAAFNVTVALITAFGEAIRVAATDPVLAVCLLFLVIVANISVQFTTQSLIQSVGFAVLNSDTDPLTGLLNRRAFYRRATELVDTAARRSDTYLAIAMIDLDKFKMINDTQGHASGDRALRAIGRTLRDNVRRSAVVARVGGEEFLIADILDRNEVEPLAERLRFAIAATPPVASASIGVVTTPLPGLAASSPHELFDELVAYADAAMYEAKRAGGNQFRHRAWRVDAAA
jgi:diguanylate cyclase (GGDEF)-like protein